MYWYFCTGLHNFISNFIGNWTSLCQRLTDACNSAIFYFEQALSVTVWPQTDSCVCVHQLVYYYMSITFTVTVALHHQAWSGPDTHWWLSPRTGTCFVSTSLLEVRVPPSSTGSGGLWPTSILFCHVNLSEDANRLWNINICFSYRYNQDLKAQEKQKAWKIFLSLTENGDSILGATLPLHLHITPSCLHNINATTINLPPLAWLLLKPCAP